MVAYSTLHPLCSRGRGCKQKRANSNELNARKKSRKNKVQKEEQLQAQQIASVPTIPVTYQNIENPMASALSQHINMEKCQKGHVLYPDGITCDIVHFVDNGSFGCVIQPPISDDAHIIHTFIEYTDRINDDVGKLYKKGAQSFQDEMDILFKIDNLDPESKFTCKLKGANVVSADVLEQFTTVTNCLYKKSNIKKKHFFQIIFENGGTEILLHPKISYIAFLKLFKQFLQGIEILHSKNIVHRDMKPSNVLLKSDKLSVIDFGLSCHVSKVFTTESYHVLSYLYKYYPPEFFVCYLILKNKGRNKKQFNEFLNTIYETMTKNGYFNQSYMNKEIKQQYEVGVLQFLQNIRDEGLYKFKDIFTKDMAFKADVFGIGHVIIHLYHIIDFENDSQKLFVDSLKRYCLECNPYNRITVSDLYQLVQKEADNYSHTHRYIQGGKLIKTSCDKMPKTKYVQNTPVP